MTTTDYRNTGDALLTDDSSNAWDGLLIVGGYLLIRQLPSLLDRIFSFASHFMSNGYAVHLKKGDFELRIGNGKDVWKDEERSEGDAAVMPSEEAGNCLNAAGA